MVTLRTLFALGIILTLACSSSSVAQWSQSSGPFGRDIQDFRVDGKRIFAITSDGVFLSTDTGESWNGISNGLTSSPYWFRSMAVSGPNLLVTSNFGGPLRSSDNGETWTAFTPDISGAPIWDFTACDSNIFAGTWGAGVFRSTDGGATWTAINAGLSDLSVGTLFTRGSVLFASNSVGLFLSKNHGSEWSQVSLEDMSIGPVVVSDTTLFAFRYPGVGTGLYRSSDWGKHWVLVADANVVGFVEVLAVCNTTLFAGSSTGLLRCSITGGTWTRADSGLTNRALSALAVCDSTLFAGSAHGGAYLSTDYGATWNECRNGLTGRLPLAIPALARDGENVLAGTWGGGVFVSSDEGASWHETNQGLGDWTILSLAVKGGSVFAGTAFRGVARSTNHGASWIAANAGLPITGTVQTFFPMVARDSTLFVAFSTPAPGVYRSTDDGGSWTSVGEGLPLSVGQVVCMAASDSALFLGGSGVYHSIDDGSSWIADTDGMTAEDRFIQSLVADGADVYAASTRGTVYHSTNMGATWSTESSGLPGLGHPVYCMAMSGENVFAGVEASGVFLSTDHGFHWAEVSLGLAYPPLIRSIVATGSNIFVGLLGGVGEGLWSRPISQMLSGIADRQLGRADRFALDQNYPNPFNPSTTIRYTLARRGQVSLDVYNVVGELVRNLVRGTQEAGSYQLRFDGSNLASGVYFCRLVAGGAVQTKRLMLLR